MKYIVITTTFEDKQQAHDLAKLLLDEHLISCAQVSEISSMYHWKGEIVDTTEYIVTMKSKESLYQQIENIIKSNHTYDVPQIIALPIIHGSKEYLEWIDNTTIN